MAQPSSTRRLSTPDLGTREESGLTRAENANLGAVHEPARPIESCSGETYRKHEEPSSPRLRILENRYRVLSYIDSGGTADIFAAEDLTNGARVAVKILNPKAATDPLLRRYFLFGARGALRIQHPNIVRVYAVEEPEDAAPFAVMEEVPGKPLWELLRGDATLPPALVIELALQAARGLEAAHQRGMVHCDIKPENLLVVEEAGRPWIKVIDFDLAAIDDEEDSHEHPLLRGTAKYMAPEQVVGDRVDPRTDVYALGVVMFRMLTGHLPFELELSPTLLFHQLASPVPPASWLCDELDPRLEAIVSKCLCKAPANRYQTMSDVVLDLGRLGTDEPLLAERPSQLPDAYVPATSRGHEAAHLLTRTVTRTE
jgi:serine/threonine protein kinase